MKSSHILSTKSKNKYFYNRKNNEFFLIHPVFEYILEQKDKNIDLYKWFIDLPDYIIIENYGRFSKSTVKFYYLKYFFLDNNKKLAQFKTNDSLGITVDSEQIKTEFTNCEVIAFEVTEKCNLSCTYCTYSKNFNWFDKRKNKNLSFSTTKIFLDYFFQNHELNSVSVFNDVDIGFYGGEPLLNFDLIKKIVEYAKKLKLKRSKLSFSMTTNALLIERYADFLVENDFDLLISLDGNEVNNSYRIFHDGEYAFKNIMYNILFIKNNYPDYFKNKVNFNSVLHSASKKTGK